MQTLAMWSGYLSKELRTKDTREIDAARGFAEGNRAASDSYGAVLGGGVGIIVRAVGSVQSASFAR